MKSTSVIGFAFFATLFASILSAQHCQAVVIYSENFSGYTGTLPGNLTTTNPPSTPAGTRGFGTAVTRGTNGGGSNPADVVQVTTAGNIFGVGNNYLHYNENVGTGSSSSNIQTADIPGLGEQGPVQLSFKFSIPTGGLILDGNGAPLSGIVILLTDGTTSDSNKRTVALEFKMADTDGDTDYEPAFVFQGGGTPYIPINFDQVYEVEVAANYSMTNTIDYALGAQSIAPTTYDVWLDGNKVRDNVNFRSTTLNQQNPGANPLIGDADRLTIRATGSDADATVNLDDIEIRNDIVLGLPTITVNRTTGNISMTNTTGGTISDIVGYTITSAAGTLNSDDDVWHSVQDNNGLWVELALTNGKDVSESNLNGEPSPVSIANNETRSFGNIWFKHPVEDVQFKLQFEDEEGNEVLVPLPVTFTGGNAYAQGDINFDGLINAADVTKFALHFNQPLGSTAAGESYGLGDFNGDLVNDYLDLLTFRAIYDAANGPGTFSLAMSASTVPEPSSMISLALLLGVAGCWKRVARLGVLSLSALMALFAAEPLQATIIFEEYFDGIPAGNTLSVSNSAFTTLITSATTPHILQATDDINNNFSDIVGNNYLKMVDGGSGNPRAVGPADLTTATGFQFSFDFIDFAATAENMRLGLGNAAGDNSQATVDFEFRGTGFGYRSTNIVANYNVGQMYHVLVIGNYGDKPIIYNNVESVNPRTFDVWLDEVRVSDNQPMSNQPAIPAVAGTLKSTHINVRAGSSDGTGDINFDNIVVDNEITAFSVQGEATLTLEVNTSTGQMQIKNTFTQLPIDLDYYKITGPAGVLNWTNWNSLDDQDGPDADEAAGWVEGGASSSTISEFTRDNSQASVVSGAPLSLGSIYNTASGAAGSLVFQYALDNGAVVNGLLSLVTSTTLDGDFNNDGIVNLADYTVWRDNVGAASDTAINNAGDGVAGVTTGDYNVWKGNFGASNGAIAGVSSSLVPEPSSLLLVAIGGLALVGRMARSQRG